MCRRYFWTKTKRYKTVGNCITMLGFIIMVILGTQAIYNIYVYIIMYVMNILGTEDGVW